jgi:hypothetical protein
MRRLLGNTIGRPGTTLRVLLMAGPHPQHETDLVPVDPLPFAVRPRLHRLEDAGCRQSDVLEPAGDRIARQVPRVWCRWNPMARNSRATAIPAAAPDERHIAGLRRPAVATPRHYNTRAAGITTELVGWQRPTCNHCIAYGNDRLALRDDLQSRAPLAAVATGWRKCGYPRIHLFLKDLLQEPICVGWRIRFLAGQAGRLFFGVQTMNADVDG